MAGLLALLLISSFAVTFVAGNCDKDVVNKIEGLNIDTSKVLQSVSGTFDVAYSTVNLDSASKKCPTSSFYKVGSEYKVNNNWVAHGEVTIKADGAAVDTIDNGRVVRKTYPVYQSPDNSQFAFYTCYVEGIEGKWKGCVYGVYFEEEQYNWYRQPRGNRSVEICGAPRWHPCKGLFVKET